MPDVGGVSGGGAAAGAAAARDASATGRAGETSATGHAADGGAAWRRLRAQAARYTPGLRSPLPVGPVCCPVCRGPALPGYRRCYQCGTHLAEAPGLLADAVVPVAYAVRGGRHATALWMYKSDRPGAASARAVLRTLLLVFLRDHGGCVWRRAAMPPPTRLAVVPGGQGRPGPHPLLTLLVPYLALPLVPLAVRPGEPLGRSLNPWRFTAGHCARGASVLLVDDTWVSGASAQSAAVALRMAGARHVAVVVLGRHVDPADPRSAGFLRALAASGFDPATCAVHEPADCRAPPPASFGPCRAPAAEGAGSQ